MSPICRTTTIFSSGARLGSFTTLALVADIFPGTVAAYSFRKLRANYGGSAVRIRRASDNAEQDFGFAGGINFDSSGAASFIGGSTGFIHIWYDQSGNGKDASQATAANQPQYIAGAVGSFPAMDFSDAVQQGLFTATTVVMGGTKATAVCIGLRHTAVPTNSRLVSFTDSAQTNDSDNTGSAVFLQNDASGGGFKGFRNSVSLGTVAGATETTFRLEAIYDGTNYKPYVNGTVGTTAASTSTFASNGKVNIGLNNMSDAGGFLKGRISEVMVWNSDQTSSIGSIDANMSTYWGV